MNARALALVLVSILPLATARADALPEPDYVERCTMPNHAREGRECRECRSYYQYPADHCANEVGPGYAKACRTDGGPWWTEIWCRDATDPAPSTMASASSPEPGTNTSESSPTTRSAATAAPSAEAEDCSTTPANAMVIPSFAALVAYVVARRRVRAAR